MVSKNAALDGRTRKARERPNLLLFILEIRQEPIIIFTRFLVDILGLLRYVISSKIIIGLMRFFKAIAIRFEPSIVILDRIIISIRFVMFLICHEDSADAVLLSRECLGLTSVLDFEVGGLDNVHGFVLFCGIFGFRRDLGAVG